MSSDQRPAKVRVFSSQSGMPNPGRRRGDDAPPADAPLTVGQTAPAVPESPSRGGQTMLLAGLFVLGCAIGGALLAWFGFARGAGS